MDGPRIVLAGTGSTLDGLTWEARDVLRIGRQYTMDIVLKDMCVNKVQAEVRRTGRGWLLRDLASNPSTPSYLNGMPVCGGEARLSLHDRLQFGRTQLKVAALELEKVVRSGENDTALLWLPGGSSNIKTSHGIFRVTAAAHRTWDEALQTIVSDPLYQDRQSEHLLTLLRTGHHLCHLGSLDELLQAVLGDAVAALDAQRGAIVLTNGEGHLQLRALQTPRLSEHTPGLGYSRTLSQRSFSVGESLLCQDVRAEAALQSAASVRRGAMSSIICALLRTPRCRLGVLHLDRGPLQDPFTPYDFCLADAVAASISVGIESALAVEQQREEFIQSVTSLARAVEMRDQYTGDHTRRVTEYAMLLAHELQLTPGEVYHLRIGTPLHDIGKIGVDDAILRKPGRLTGDEFEVMKTHTLKGASILQSMASLDPMIPIIRHHHERWDGRGYPDGLVSEQIPPIARVVAVADAFDAMTSDRPYRAALSLDLAFAEMRKCAGSHFDPKCVEAFLKLRPEVERFLGG